jgi:hypothetical protein
MSNTVLVLLAAVAAVVVLIILDRLEYLSVFRRSRGAGNNRDNH